MVPKTPVSISTVKNTDRGFTIVELIIAIPILVIVGGVVLALLFNYLSMFIANNDAVVASQRANMVLRLLDDPVHHAGLGINTKNPDEYKKSWKEAGDPEASDSPFPARWEGFIIPEYEGENEGVDAIILSGDKGDGYFAGIGILYAVPTGMKIKDEVPKKGEAITTNVPFEISLLPLNYNLHDKLPVVNKPEDLRSWLTMPGTNKVAPMLVTSIKSNAGNQKTLEMKIPGAVPGKSGDPFVIPMHQELFAMRAVMAYVYNNTFEMIEITDSGTHYGSGVNRVTSIENVRGIRFKLSEDRKYLEVRVLAMGDSRGAKHAQTLSPQLRNRWDELTAADSGTYFEEFSVKWRVRDLYAREKS